MDGHDQRDDGCAPESPPASWLGDGFLRPGGSSSGEFIGLAIGGFILLSDDLKCVVVTDLLRARGHQVLEMLEAVLVCGCDAEYRRVKIGL